MGTDGARPAKVVYGSHARQLAIIERVECFGERLTIVGRHIRAYRKEALNNGSSWNPLELPRRQTVRMPSLAVDAKRKPRGFCVVGA